MHRGAVSSRDIVQPFGCMPYGMAFLFGKLKCVDELGGRPSNASDKLNIVATEWFDRSIACDPQPSPARKDTHEVLPERNSQGPRQIANTLCSRRTRWVAIFIGILEARRNSLGLISPSSSPLQIAKRLHMMPEGWGCSEVLNMGWSSCFPQPASTSV